jgi:vacuolar protein sorting-associated protein 35
MLDEKADAPAMSLRLFLLGAQAADYCGFEDLAYEFFVQTFSVYEESISDSRQQLQAITTIIGALQHVTVFSKDSYDTLSTKAALHAAKLLKKPHQSMAVQVASHLWWQAPQVLAAEVNGMTNRGHTEAASGNADDMIVRAILYSRCPFSY